MFIKKEQINVNWLLNQVMGAGKTNYKITKIDDEQVLQFIQFLVDNPFEMPDGSDALQWVRNRLSIRLEQAQNQMSQQWEFTRQRYKFIIQQIDIAMVKNNRLAKPIGPTENIQELNVSFGGDNGLSISFEN